MVDLHVILWKEEPESGGGEVDVLEKAVTENGHWGLLVRFCFNLLSSGVRTNFTECWGGLCLQPWIHS